MPWRKGRHEYMESRKKLLESQNPSELIKSVIAQEPSEDKDDILSCFADTMKEVAEGSDAGKQKEFETAALSIYDSAPKITNAFYVGLWNKAFIADPGTTIDALAAQQPEFRKNVLASFTELLGAGAVQDMDGAIKARLTNLSEAVEQELAGGISSAPSVVIQEPVEDRAEDLVTLHAGSKQPAIALSQGLDGDPITKAIRERVLAAQREVITKALVAAPHQVDHVQLDSPEKFRAYSANPANAAKLEAVFKDKAVKTALEKVTLEGQQGVMKQFSDQGKDPHFSPIKWSPVADSSTPGVTVRSQVVKDENGIEIHTLKESTETFTPAKKVKNSNGEEITITKSRTIDLPDSIGDGDTMHVSLVLKDKDGKAPPKSKAVYFTAHYEDGQLVEMSCPTPVKFGPAPGNLGYIEHEGQIYTIPVTKDKYDSMMRTIAENRGQGEAVNLSQNQDGRMLSGIGGEQVPELQVSVGQAMQPQLTGTFMARPAEQLLRHEGAVQSSVSSVKSLPPRPRPSVLTKLTEEEETAALNKALLDSGSNLPRFLARLKVNHKGTVTIQAALPGGEDIVIKATSAQEFLTKQRKDGKVTNHDAITLCAELEAEIGKSIREEDLSRKTSVVVKSMRARLSLPAPSVGAGSVSSPPPTRVTAAGKKPEHSHL